MAGTSAQRVRTTVRRTHSPSSGRPPQTDGQKRNKSGSVELMMRADGAEIVGFFFDTFVDEAIVAGDIDASKRCERRAELMVIKKRI